MSTRDVLKKATPKVHPVELDDGVVYVRALSGAGRQRYLDMASDGQTPSPARIAALGLCEADGTLVYDLDADDDVDVKELEELDGGVLDRIATRLFEVSGLTKTADENAEKKSEGSQSG